MFTHTPEGTPYRVALVAGTDPSTVELTVDDAGPGIPDTGAVLARGAMGAGSTGLGLDIARQGAESAGGRLAVTLGPMGGARVTLVLPLA